MEQGGAALWPESGPGSDYRSEGAATGDRSAIRSRHNADGQNGSADALPSFKSMLMAAFGLSFVRAMIAMIAMIATGRLVILAAFGVLLTALRALFAAVSRPGSRGHQRERQRGADELELLHVIHSSLKKRVI